MITSNAMMLAQISPMYLAIAAIPISLAVGFTLGLVYERWYQASNLQRVSRRFERLFEHAQGILSRAEQACGLLNRALPSESLNPDQRSRLKSVTGRLNEKLQGLVGYTEVAAETIGRSGQKRENPTANEKSRSRWKAPSWTRSPADARTGLPDAVAYDQNFSRLIKAIHGSPITCGMLYVRLDHYSRHEQRLGAAVADDFVRQAAGLTLRQLRNQDLLCQISEDWLIALIPDVTLTQLEYQAQSARRAIRNHHFLQLETQQPVFVTASFGFSCFTAELAKTPDPAQILWERGQQAIRASEKQGRCQLYEVTDLGTSRLVAG